MAAKQGLTAHLSQAGEDAKRAVLSRTGVTSSWFSNLNTVCTIKSAPPRTPEVLQMLATKSGWLYKRNEQHVWQARWCCVVPHMFLYYFDADIGAGPPNAELQNPTTMQQDEWNRAVQNGYGNRKQHEKRSSLYLFNHQSTPAAHQEPALHDMDGHGLSNGNGDSSKFTSLQPAGIVDLECYTSLHRSTENNTVLELAGDDQVNPDLRAFYFCATNEEDCDEWSAALLNQRHAALLDECDAYKQVCEGFAQQLQVLHAELDQQTMVASEAQDELYRVRSQHEDNRRSTWRMLEDFCEKPTKATVVDPKRRELRSNLDTIRSQDLGVQAAVRMLLEYADGIEGIASEMHQERQHLEEDLKQMGQSDQAKVQQLEAELALLKGKFDEEKKQWESQLEAATQKYEQSQKELADVQKELNSTRMEITMYQSQQRTKVSELQQHKKILKKEVLDLRGKLDNANSELSMLKHQQENTSLRAEQERQKAALLERYVEKIESQVKVQQNMMEMMSASGSVHGGSVYGSSRSVHLDRSVGQVDHYNSPHGRTNVVYVHTSDPDDEADLDHEEDQEDQLNPLVDSQRRRQAVDDIDNKSHLSELTEDRTQRHLDVFHRDDQYYNEYNGNGPSPQTTRKSIPRLKSPRTPGPPSYIIGMNHEPNDNDNSKPPPPRPHSSSQSLNTPPMKRSEIPRGNQLKDNGSVASETKKLSVAQRARMEADRQSTPVKIRLDSQPGKAAQSPPGPQSSSPQSRQMSQQGTTHSQNSIWKVMEDVLAGSKNGDDDDYTSDDESLRSTRVTDYTEGSRRTRDSRVDDEEKKMNDSVSVSNVLCCACSLILYLKHFTRLHILFLKIRISPWPNVRSYNAPSN